MGLRLNTRPVRWQRSFPYNNPPLFAIPRDLQFRGPFLEMFFSRAGWKALATTMDYAPSENCPGGLFARLPRLLRRSRERRRGW